METCNVVLTFNSVDEILWCDHSNETSLAVRLRGTICFSIFYIMKFGIFLKFGFLALLSEKELRYARLAYLVRIILTLILKCKPVKFLIIEGTLSRRKGKFRSVYFHVISPNATKYTTQLDEKIL